MFSKKLYARAYISTFLFLGAIFLTGCDDGFGFKKLNYCYESFDMKTLPDSLEHKFQIELKGVNELSGICLSSDGKVLYGVDDEGKFVEIYIGDILNNLSLEEKSRKKTSVKYNHYTVENNMFNYPGLRHEGMEDISIDPEGNIYIGLEEEDKCVYKTKYIGPGSSPSNNTKDNAEKYVKDTNVDNSSNEAFKFTYECGDNEGVEGLTWFKRGGEEGIYAGTQTDCMLFNYSLDGQLRGTPISLQNSEGMTEEKKANGHKIDEIAGLDFDVINDRLWVIDSNYFRIFVFNGDGTKLIKSYDISDMIEDPSNKDHNNPEGLCIDLIRKCIWVCEDIDGTSILHKYNFKYY